MDRRLKVVTLADIQEQSKLARKIHQRFGEAISSVASIRSVRRDLEDRVRRANNAAVTAEGEKLKARLGEIEEKIYQVRSRDTHSGAQYGARIVDKLGHLLGSYVSGQDAGPTRQAYEAFDTLSRELQTQLDRLGNTVKTDLPRFNQLLERAKLTPVTISE